MHLKRYKTKLGYKYMILEAGTNRCLVNLGCVSPREAQAELRSWLTYTKRQQAIAKFRLHDDTLLVTDYLKQYVERYLPAKAQKTIISELEAITKFKEFFTGIPLGHLTKADLQRYINWRLAARHSRRGTPMACARAVTVLDTIPGVDRRGGELLVAAWGIDMTRFGTIARLAAWSGVAPGHDERAGTQRSGKTRQGHRALRTGLTPLAHAAALTTGTDVSALSHRLAARRGKTRAIMAVAHSIVVSAFHMLSRNEPYQELGATSFDDHQREHLVDRLTRRLEHLGDRVSLEPVPAV